MMVAAPFARSARLGVAPALLDMEMMDTIGRSFVEVVKPPESFDGATVSLLNGARLHPTW